MPSVRTCALVAALTATLAAAAPACGDRPVVPAVAPSDVHLAAAAEPGSSAADGSHEEAVASPGVAAGRRDTAAVMPCVASSSAASSAGRPAADPTDRLEAARTVQLYCTLIDKGQFARAADLCTRRRLWSRHALSGVTRFRFRSARVFAAPDRRTLILRARVRTRCARGHPLPDGLSVLFFTLGRAGGNVGGWRISAVSTRP